MKKIEEGFEPIPEASLLDTIGGENIEGLLSDAGEFSLDMMIQDGVLRDIPIVNTVVGLARIGLGIRDYLFLKKTVRFLRNLRDIPVQERNEFIKKLDGEKGFRENVQENLFLLLHRLDDMQKPDMLGKIFKAYLKGQIDFDVYQKLCTAVDRIKIQNIPHLIEFYREYDSTNFNDLFHREIGEDAFQDLIACGLVDMRFMPSVLLDESFDSSRIADLGKLFVEIVFGKG